MIKPLKFTNLDRQSVVEKLQADEFDIAVIGGGITGAGIALDAASRGLKVALVEKGDFASGTSSKSTKLIHGGLRYLKQFDFWLVKEVGSERAIVHKLAPHLVLPEKMLLPLIEGGSYGKWLTSIGLKVYDILAQVGGDDKRQMLEKKEALALEPLLPKKILKGAGFYAEYRTDDARLTIENIKTSLAYGAQALNYAQVTDFLYYDGHKVSGVKVKDLITDNEFEIRAKYVISAAGPWVDELRAVNHSKKGKRLHLTKGVHLVFPHEKLPVRQSVYFDVPDGRMIFAIPRGKVTYVGTTDTNFDLDKDHVTTDIADAIYLISAVNNMFPKIDLELEDIESSWAGLRPLIHEEGKSASELSRKDEIFTSDTGLISMAGGKLTGYRKMAERVVNRVAKKMKEDYDIDVVETKTAEIPLCGNDFKKFKHVHKYIEEVFHRIEADGFSEYDAWFLVTNYGKQAEIILDKYEAMKEGEPKIRMAMAELQFCIDYEMVINPMDFFIRRTGRLYFDIQSVRQLLEPVLEEIRKAYGVDQEQIDNWRSTLEHELDEHSNFSVERI